MSKVIQVEKIIVMGLLGSLMVGSFGGSPTKLHQRGGHGAPHQSAPPSHPSGGGGGQVHARRETVRTNNYVPRPMSPSTGHGMSPGQNNRGGQVENPRHVLSAPTNSGTLRRPRPISKTIATNQRRFTKTTQGRVYDNGLRLRKGMTVTASWQKRYFPRGHYYFPFYRPTFIRGRCFVSPFGFFFGVCVPFIDASECHVYPPAIEFVDTPVYNGVTCTGFQDAGEDNFLTDPNLDQDEPGLGNAIDELNETFQNGNIDGIVSLIDPNTSIAIYLRGTYKYSLAASDYIDLTRDAIQSTKNVQFSVKYLHQRAPNVFAVSGTQSYQDDNGQAQTVWISYVLQDISGQWTLTQVETAPGIYHKLTS